jgi:hypothetical protein
VKSQGTETGLIKRRQIWHRNIDKVKELIRPILTYGAETWAATESELKKLLVFERKILRKIYGPVKDQDNWRIRTN